MKTQPPTQMSRTRPFGCGDAANRRTSQFLSAVIGSILTFLVVLPDAAGGQTLCLDTLLSHKVKIYAPVILDRAIKGTLIDFTSDTLVVGEQDGRRYRQYRIPKSAVTGFQIRTRSHSHPMEGAVLGGIAGVGIGFAIGSQLFPSHSHTTGLFGDLHFGDIATNRGILWGGGIGLVTGLLVGSMITTGEWQDVSLSRLQLGVIPDPSGNLRFSMAFNF